MPDDRAVQGYCPMGCGRTLFLADGGYVTCSCVHCPRPDAVADILDDRESGHIVDFSEHGFTIRHPLRERLDDALMECALHEYCEAMAGPPVRPGRYRATRSSGKPWAWEAIS
jgi:Family of unknown function (DUF6085)